MAVFGGALAIWQIIMFLCLQKLMFSMWILVHILQHYVFIAMWQINYPSLTQVVFKELRRIALGEFLEGLEIGRKLA